MERCLLLDLPAGALQAIVDNLSPADHASLREVSRSVCERTTAHIPCISLLLTDNTDLLQQWHQATRSLQHVPNIRVHVACNITAEVFDAAMQLLSERTNVRELHVLVAPGAVHDPVIHRTSIDTLLPLQHILPSLQILVIKDIAVPDLLGDLKQLAAAATTAQGWRLQNLTCHVYCYVIKTALCDSSCQLTPFWSEFSRIVLQLPSAFPFLQHLSWKVSVMKHVLYDFLHSSSDTGHSAVEGQQQAPELVTEEVAKCAVTTAVAHAVLQLKCLEILKISQIPGVCKGDTAPSAVAAALTALLDQSGLPQSSSPAATAATFTTLDDYGCWLLQHHPKLRQLQIKEENLNWADCGMSWQQQQQQPDQRINGRSDPGKFCKSAELVDLILSSDCSQHLQFTRRLSHYSSRPAALLMKHISSCHLSLYNDHVGFLADLFSEMEYLKHLEVHMQYHIGRPRSLQTDVSTAFSAAAAVPGLQSLSMDVYGVTVDSPVVCLTDDLLLPLTAAAGGPGSSLTRLVLSGTFVSSEAAGATTARVASWVARRSLQHALLQLGGLRELVILNEEQLLDLQVDCLPAGLEVLEGERLNIMMGAAAADGLGGCSSSACCKLLPSTVQATHEAPVMCPHLQTLTLTSCQLSSPNILASDRLQQLTVDDSSWAGGWAAAAAAWPSLHQLVWVSSSESSSSSSGSSSSGSSSSGSSSSGSSTGGSSTGGSSTGGGTGGSSSGSEHSAETMPSAGDLALTNSNLFTTLWDVFDVFRCVKSFEVHHDQVDKQFAGRREAALQQLQQSGRAYVWHSRPGYRTRGSLLVRCSSLGDMGPSSYLRSGTSTETESSSST